MADDKEKTTKIEEGDVSIHSMEIPPEKPQTTDPKDEPKKEE